MDINDKKIGNITLLELSGRIDAYTAEQLEEALKNNIDSEKLNFVINFKSVNYISSAGLRVFLGAHKKLSETGGIIRFSQMPDSVLKVFALAGFDKIFEIYTSDSDALNEFSEETKKAA